MKPNKVIKYAFSLMLALLISFYFSCIALSAPTEIPDAGTILNSPKETLSPPEKTNPNIEIIEQEQPVIQSEQKIKVNGFYITGQNLYSQEILLPFINDVIGEDLTLAELQYVAAKISQYIRNDGYYIVSAYIPGIQPQNEGLIEITVVIGKYDKINIRNKSKLKLSTIEGLLSNIKGGDYIRNDTLDRTLLLLSDINGISSKATLIRGELPGTCDLIIDVNDTIKMDGYFYVDNYGNQSTGENRSGLNIKLNNLSGIGDIINFGGTYTGSGMNDYSFSYSLPVGNQGAKINVGYSKMHYSLGGDFTELNANGLSETIYINGSYPFIRSRDFNLNFNIGYSGKHLQDRIDIFNSDSRKKSSVLNVGVSGDKYDKSGKGVTSFVLNYSHGQINMDSLDAQTGDIEAQTAGTYSKTTLSLYRNQYINRRLNFNLLFNGQLASKNLDSSEKLSLGGANGIRAYSQGYVSGDEGYIVTGELRWNMPTPKFQIAYFIDHGRVRLNKNPWYISNNNRSLTGAGIGLIWSKQKDYSIRCDYAFKLNSNTDTSDSDKNGRFWIQAVKYF